MPESTSVTAGPSLSRRLFRLATVFVLVSGLTVAALPWLVRQAIGPARLKALVADALTDALGRKVSILGDVSVIVVPWFGLSIGPLAVADAPGFGTAPMLGAAHTEVTIRILPLLAKVVSPGSVRTWGLTLHLRRDASGRSNWEELAARPDHAAGEAAGWQVAPQPQDIRVTDATVSYEDETAGRAWTFTGTRLATGLGQPFNFSLTFLVSGAIPGASLECHAQGNASRDPVSGLPVPGRIELATVLRFAGPLVPGGASPLSVLSKANLTYDPAANVLDLADLDVRLPGVRIGGSAKVTDPAGTPRAATALSLTADLDGGWRDILGLPTTVTPDSLVAQAPDVGREASREPVVVRDERLRAAVDGQVGQVGQAGQAVMTVAADIDATALTLRQAELRLPRGTASGQGRLIFGDRPVLDLDLAAEDVDLGALSADDGPVWPGLPTDWLSRWRLDARVDLRRCRFAGQTVTDFHATAKSRDGHARLYPVSAVLPSGLVSLDARLDVMRDGLSMDVRTTLDPFESGTAAPPAQTRARLLGRLEAGGAKGTLLVQCPDLETAGKVLGLADLPGLPLEGKGALAVPFASRRAGGNRFALSDLDVRLAGIPFRGQLALADGTPSRLTFDLAADSLDLDKLAALAGVGAGGSGGGSGLRAEGRLRTDHLFVHGLETQNAAANLTCGDGRCEAALTGGELFGGKLSGKIEGDVSGRIAAALQLAGADAARLPGGLQLAGPVAAKAGLEANLPRGGRLRNIQASLEAEAARLDQGRGADKLSLGSPKLAVTLASRDAQASGDDLPLDAGLTVTTPALGGLRDVRLTVQGPLVLDKTGRLREGGPAKLDGAAVWRQEGRRDLKLTLGGPLTLDTAGGGFSAGDLRCDIGGLPATAKLWRKAGESGPTAFALDTGQQAPRQVLAGWGVALPGGLAADRLAKGSLSLAGSVGEAGCDISRLTLVVDDTTIGGKVVFPKYEAGHGRFDLTVDRLDWDAYFPPGVKTTPEERRKPLDLRLLRELSLEARLAVGWLKKGNVTFENSTITAGARGGVFTFRQESPRFYGGRFFAEVRGDARGGALTSQVELKLEGFECARFMRDWVDGDTLDSGGATFILAARSSGASEAELRANLAGNARLQITRGALSVRDPSRKTPPDKASERIPFETVSSSWVGRDGVARTDDFLIESPRMLVKGRGLVDLRDETINLSVLATLADGGQAPVTIIGPLDDPKLTIDRSKIFGELLYRVLQGIVSIPGKALTHILQLH